MTEHDSKGPASSGHLSMAMNKTLIGMALPVLLSTGSTLASESPPQASGARALEPTGAVLPCVSTSNCVSSQGPNALPPLPHEGSAEQARSRLLGLLRTMQDVQVTGQTELEVRTIFTTLLGFQDEVVFWIHPQGQQIDFRSRSLKGLYDFGKNRSRMEDFAKRFAAQLKSP